MRLSTGLLLSVMLLWTFVPSNVWAIVWDEASEGELSGDFASPTDLGTLDPGSNTVSGTSTAGPTEDVTIPAAPDYPDIDVDLWMVTIDSGEYLNRIVLTAYSNDNPYDHTGGSGGIPGNGSFFGVQAGNAITAMIPDGSVLLGGGLIGILAGAQVGDDVLDDLGSGTFSAAPFNVPTFSGSLGAGTYTFWYQEGPMDTEYTLDFQVSAVPEPASVIGLGLMALVAMPAFRFRRKKERFAR